MEASSNQLLKKSQLFLSMYRDGQNAMKAKSRLDQAVLARTFRVTSLHLVHELYFCGPNDC